MNRAVTVLPAVNTVIPCSVGIFVNQRWSVVLSVNHTASLTCVVIYELYFFVMKRGVTLSSFCPISGLLLQILNILLYFSQSLVIVED